MRIYGLTGGIGSGKSEVARRFEDLDIPVIDADRIGHEVLGPGGAAVEAVAAAFGPGVLSESAIDRKKLARIVFADKAAIEKLNAIVHPAIGRVIAERCIDLAAEGREVVVVDAAVLAEGGRREEWLDGLILVTCREDLRLSRLVQLRGMDAEEARRRIASQTAPETKMPLADWVIENEGDLDRLHERVDRVAAEIWSRAR
jgi:dephospho-CoA kinase